MRDEENMEAEIQAKGLTAPRLTPTLIDGKITSAAYYVFPGTTLTICALTLANGFQVTGESAAASPENFNEEIGRKIAYENARQKIWALEGYLLREWLAYQNTPGHGEYLTGQAKVDRASFSKPPFETLSYDHADQTYRNEKGERVPDNEVVRHPQHGAIRMTADTVLGQTAGKLIGHDRSEEGAPSFKG